MRDPSYENAMKNYGKLIFFWQECFVWNEGGKLFVRVVDQRLFSIDEMKIRFCPIGLSAFMFFLRQTLNPGAPSIVWRLIAPYVAIYGFKFFFCWPKLCPIRVILPYTTKTKLGASVWIDLKLMWNRIQRHCNVSTVELFTKMFEQMKGTNQNFPLLFPPPQFQIKFVVKLKPTSINLTWLTFFIYPILLFSVIPPVYKDTLKHFNFFKKKKISISIFDWQDRCMDSNDSAPNNICNIEWFADRLPYCMDGMVDNQW